MNQPMLEEECMHMSAILLSVFNTVIAKQMHVITVFLYFESQSQCKY